ncbi:restriction endonuclease [Enterococcus plantarum]|uniref:restriction endonuclease n=1 Tax=Enterococcus plantarum TaxID=1077675 RepID=UPI0009F546AA|nr:restriction endonuclease [Enterococcus plantarum]
MNTSDWLALVKPLLENKVIWLVVGIMLLNYIYKIITFFIERNKNYELKDIDQMTGEKFEHYFANVLRKSDYKKVKVTQYQGDQGIDVLAQKENRKIGYQCKRYKKNVGNKAVQEAHAGKSFYDLEDVYVVTNSYFTKSAKELAHKTGVYLIDRDELYKLIRDITN